MDTLKWRGVLKVREAPASWTIEDFEYWWFPQLVDPKTKRVLIPARMSEKEKDHLTIATSENMLLINGVQTILSYIIDQSTTSPGVMFQYLALGNGVISAVEPADSSVSGEYYRQQITNLSNFGASAVISVVVAAGSGTSTGITNAGWFGIAASGTLGTGTLMSHVMYLPNIVKGAGQQFTFDYSVELASN